MGYLELIDQNKEEMFKTLQDMLHVKSVVSDAVTAVPEGGTEPVFMPYGKEVHEMFMKVLALAEAEGWETCNIDNQGGHFEFGGYVVGEDGTKEVVSDEVMGIICHLDVVPVGDGWICDPWSGDIIDNKMYGRGTIDNKGPLVAVMYAMKALRDSGRIPKKKVRVVLGLDEETNWFGMDYYNKRVAPPDFGITPDGEFPVVHAEMGNIAFDLDRKFAPTTAKGLELRSIKAGSAPNVVPDSARAVVKSDEPGAYDAIKDKVAAYRDRTGRKIACRGTGKSLEITTQGVAAHGSKPHLGVNAASILLDFLGELNFTNDDINDFIQFYNEHIGFELDGTKLGIGFEDEPSGKLILNVGMLNFTPELGTVTINVRYPVTTPLETVYEAMGKVISPYNIGVARKKFQKPIYIPADDPFVETLMDIYREFTGQKDAKPIVFGGGTYARAFENHVAFGPSFPGDPDVPHQKNEYIDLEKFVLLCKIMAETIDRLAN